MRTFRLRLRPLSTWLTPWRAESLFGAICWALADRALLLFLVRTGARVSEAVGVNAADLCLDAPRQVLVRGKGSKERVVPLADDLSQILRDLREERGLHPAAAAAIFVNAQGRRLTRFGVTHVVRRAVSEASRHCPPLGNRRISPHTFRHTAAMRLLQAGVDLSVIRAWLGHADIQTTHQYLEADVEMKRQALQAATITPEAPARYEPPNQILLLLER